MDNCTTTIVAVGSEALRLLHSAFEANQYEIRAKDRSLYRKGLNEWLKGSKATPPDWLVGANGAISSLKLADPASWDAYLAQFGALMEQVWYERATPDMQVSTNGYQPLGGKFVPSSDPVNAAWRAALAGDQLRLDPASFAHFTLNRTKRAPGSEKVILRGADGGATLIKKNPVGSSDTVFLEGLLSDLALENLRVACSSRSGLKTDNSRPPLSKTGGAVGVVVDCCEFFGGFDPVAGKQDDTKWGMHHYETGDWWLVGTTIRGITLEHCSYWHNPIGDHLFRACYFGHAGRTAIQMLARKGEGPEGFGAITIEDCFIEDVCLEGGGGGSALTFRGGMPTSVITIARTKIRLGCDPNLKSPWSQNITGCLVVDEEPSSSDPTQITTWPGGTGEVHLIDNDWIVGEAFGGSGAAPRAGLKVEDTFGLLEIAGGQYVQDPKAHDVVWQVGGKGVFKVRSNEPKVIGQIVYKGKKYADYAAFKADPNNAGVFTP